MAWNTSKSAEEMMNILEAYDLTGSFRNVGELAGGVPAHTASANAVKLAPRPADRIHDSIR